MSRYSKLLAKIIAESGLTIKEIAQKCNEIGNGIDVTRLSKLQNGRLDAPSEKVSRDIAKVCNANDRELVLEGYLEKAPKEVIEAFLSIRYMTTISALSVLENTFDNNVLTYIQEELEKEPLAQFIISLIDKKATDVILDNEKIEFNVEKDKFNMILNNPSSLKVKDNSMYPIIPKDAEISLKIQNKYDNGDILAIKVNNKEDFIVRYVLFKNDSIVLTSLNNKDFEKLEYRKNEVTILGKIIKVTTDIQV